MEIEVDADTIDEIALSFKGLNEFQIRQILTLAYQDGGCITRGDKALILKEKEQFIKKSGIRCGGKCKGAGQGCHWGAYPPGGF